MTATLNPRTETAKLGAADTNDTDARQELGAAANPDATPSGINAGLAEDSLVQAQAPLLIDVRSAAEFAAVSEELQVFAETLARPYCGSTAGFGTASWFGEHAAHIRSQALIAPRNGGGTIGMIALGSEDMQRFYTDMGTLYLERLGEMVSAALARVTKSVL